MKPKAGLLAAVLALTSAAAFAQTIGNGAYSPQAAVTPGPSGNVCISTADQITFMVDTCATVRHTEPFELDQSSMSCALGSLCTIGTANFATPFPVAPRCSASPNGTVVGNIAFAPVIVSRTTTSVTIGLQPLIALLNANISVTGVCSY